MSKIYSTNLLTNPNAVDGTTGWTTSNVTVENEAFKLTGTASMEQEVAIGEAQIADFSIGVDFKPLISVDPKAVQVNAFLKVQCFYTNGSIDTFVLPCRQDIPTARSIGDGWYRIKEACQVREDEISTVKIAAITDQYPDSCYFDNFLLRQSLDAREDQEIEFEPPEVTEPPEKPPVDVYGINPEYLKFYPNKCANSGFEVFDSGTMKPHYWDTDGVVSPDSSFDNTYSLKLTPNQYAIQAEDDTGFGPADPFWWSWCQDTRISFRVKGNGGRVRVSVEQGGANQSLWYWEKNSEGEWVKVTAVSYLEFDTASDWPASLRTFCVTPQASGKIKLRFDNVGSVDIYIDAVIIEPDWTGRWPSFYTGGPKSQIEVAEEYFEYGSADWNASGVEFTLENAYISRPVAVASVESDTPTDFDTADFQLVIKYVQETVNGVPDCYSKIQVIPKGSSIPASPAGAKITLYAVCTGAVSRA